MENQGYVEISSWVGSPGDSNATKSTTDCCAVTHTLPQVPPKPRPLPKPRQSTSSTISPILTRQHKQKPPVPLPGEGYKPLPPLPLSSDSCSQLEVPNEGVAREPGRVTSEAYSLEDFHKQHEFPQIVRVVGGHLGVTEEHSMSEGEELVLFFVKRSQVVVASSHGKSDLFFIPLNSSLQLVPRTDATSAKSDDYFQRYKTVEDLLMKKKGDLPKVMKVCKTYSGKTAQSSVVEGERIFPQKVSTSFRKKKVLECFNTDKKLLKLESTCEGNFSVNPADIKMSIPELVTYITDFPISVMVINEQTQSSRPSSILTGTILTLEEPKPLQSYICSIDVFGEMDYPLMEMPISMPIKIQCIQYPGLDLKPMFSKIQHTYENFKPSLIRKNMFSSQSTSEMTTQQELYEEVQTEDGSTHIYDLEKPNIIYDSIPADMGNVAISVDHTPTLPSCTPPELPPRDELSSTTMLNSHHLTGPVMLPSEVETKEIATSIPVPTSSASFSQNIVRSSDSSSDSSSKEENVVYLKSFNLAHVLQLLENMNLGQYKESFADEQVDGEMIVHLGRAELVDLGINRSIHQTRLLKLIDGTVSAKKYEGGAYASLKKMQSLP